MKLEEISVQKTGPTHEGEGMRTVIAVEELKLTLRINWAYAKAELTGVRRLGGSATGVRARAVFLSQCCHEPHRLKTLRSQSTQYQQVSAIVCKSCGKVPPAVCLTMLRPQLMLGLESMLDQTERQRILTEWLLLGTTDPLSAQLDVLDLMECLDSYLHAKLELWGWPKPC